MAEEPDLLISAGFSDAQLVREANKIVDLYKKKGAEAEKAFVDAQGKVTNTKAVQAHKRELDRLSKAYDPVYRAAKQYENELKRLDRALDIGAINQKQYTTQVELAAAALQRVNQPMVAATQSGNRFGGSLQQVGYQVGDFAVQVGAGTSATQALGQQLPQLLGSFGTYGALAGAAAAITIPLAAALFKMSGGSADAKETLEELTKQTDAYTSAAGVAATSIAELREEYGDLAEEIQNVSGIQASFLGELAKRNLTATAGLLSGAFGDLENSTGDALTIAGVEALETFREIRSELGDNEEAAEKFVTALRKLNTAKGPEDVISIVEDLQQVIAEAALSGEKVSPRMEEFFSQIGKLAENAADQVGAANRVQEQSWQRLVEKYSGDTEKLKELNADRIAAENALVDAIKSSDQEKINSAKAYLTEIRNQIGATKELIAENDKVLQRRITAQKNFQNSQQEFSGINSSAIDTIKQFEGFISTAKWDVNAFRAGFGSDTVTLADGSVKQITEGMSVSLADANRDLVRRVGEFQATVVGQVGADRFDSFTQEQQAALTSIAYNYGSLPDRIIDAVRTGTSSDIANAIGGLSGDNAGVNSDRRFKEASAFGSASISKDAFQTNKKNLEDEIKERERLADQVKKFGEQLQQNLLTSQQQAELEAKRVEKISAIKAQDLTPGAEADAIAAVNAEIEKQATIYKLLEDAKRRNVDLDATMAGSTLTYREAIASLGEAQRQQILNQHEVAKAQKDTNQAQEFFKQQQQELEQGIVSAIVNGENFADVLGNIAKKFAEAALQAALFGNGPLSGGGASLGGILGSIGKFLGFADGGYTGSGGKYQAAGIVHRGEYVMDADSVRRAGGPAAFDALRRGLKGYADGGYVMPSIPQPIMPKMSAVGQPAPKITINNNAPGVDVQADYATKDEVNITIAKAIAGNSRRQADSQYLNGRR